MWQTIGHEKTIDLLQRALSQGNLSHAYLLTGPAHIGKMTLALDLARVLNCRAEAPEQPCGECSACLKISESKHADVQIIGLNYNTDPDDTKNKTEIGIDQINEMLHQASLPPFEGKYRVYIIDEAANLSIDAANRLLKTLEEPPAKVIFILLTSSAGLIPMTVISRCQRLNLNRLSVKVIEEALIEKWEVEQQKASLLSRLSQGCIGWAIEAINNETLMQNREEIFEQMLTVISGDYSSRFGAAARMAQQFSKKRETIYETMDAWTKWFRDILLVKTGCDSDIISIDHLDDFYQMAGNYSLEQIKSAIKYLLDAVEQLKLNANARLVLEVLMLNLPRVSTMGAARKIEVKNA